MMSLLSVPIYAANPLESNSIKVASVTYEVPEGVTNVTSDTIANSNEIETLILPSTAVWNDIEWEWATETNKNVSNYDFPKLKKIIVSEQNPTLSSQDGVLFDKNKETLLYYPPNKEGKSYTVPEGVTTIKKYAFQSKNLKEILLPNSLKIIEERAFYFTNLKELSIPDTINLSASSLNGLPNSTISVKFSGNIKRIENSTLKREEKITKVGLAEGLEEIGEAAFDMTSMNVVAIPKSVKKIEKGAFRRSSLDFVIYRGTKKDFYNLIQEAGFDDRPNRKMPELVKEVNLVIDGMPIDFDGLAERPFYYKNKVYVPSQYICNLCGISTKWISWNPETAQYQKDDIVVKLVPQEKIIMDRDQKATVNEKEFKIEGEILLLNEDSPFTPENTGTGIPITVEELEGNQSTIYCPISNILKQFEMKSYYNILKNTLYIETK